MGDLRATDALRKEGGVEREKEEGGNREMTGGGGVGKV